MLADQTGGSLYKPFFLNVFLLFLVAGCQTRDVRVDAHHDFAIEGKLAVRSVEGQHSARFRWQQLGDSYRIELWGPLGQGRTILEGNARRLKIRDGGGRILQSGAVRTVMQKQLGWYLPLEALPQWVLGGPIPNLPVDRPQIDTRGRMLAFAQLGWSLGFVYEGEAREPRRVTATMGSYRVLMVVDRAAPAG